MESFFSYKFLAILEHCTSYFTRNVTVGLLCAIDSFLPSAIKTNFFFFFWPGRLTSACGFLL